MVSVAAEALEVAASVAAEASAALGEEVRAGAAPAAVGRMRGSNDSQQYD